MKVNFAHLCDYALISREGKLSVLGIFSQLFAAKLPTVHPLLHVVFEVELSPAELGHEMHIEVQCADADGGVIVKAEAKFRLDGQAAPGARIPLPQVIPFVGVQLQKPGTHAWSIFVNGVHAKDIPFEVQLVKAPPGPAGA